MKVILSTFFLILISPLETTLNGQLKRKLETNAIAPTISGTVYPKCCYRATSESQLQLTLKLKTLIKNDVSLKRFISSRQPCKKGK